MDIQEQTTEAFMTHIREQVRSGYGLIPFAGSGISARSGIMMGSEFTEYITWVVYRSVALEEEQWAKIQIDKRWNVRRQGWPRPPKPSEMEVVTKWVRDQFQDICKRCGVGVGWTDNGRFVRYLTAVGSTPGMVSGTADEHMRRPLVPAILWSGKTEVSDAQIHSFWNDLDLPNRIREILSRPTLSPDSTEAISERAIRSLYRWNATLEFLAELATGEQGTSRSLYISPRDLSVIDSFNAHITRGRKPNLTHSMLCHLAELLRSRMVLTTNFDSLLEEAFAQLHEHYAVLSVSIFGHLPSVSTVTASNCILKLHGTLSETRADFSLDLMPSLQDRERFFRYICGHPPRKAAPTNENNLPLHRRNYAENHLLVVGYSGNDNRCVQLIKYVLDHSPNTKIFWLCFSQADLDCVDKLFPEAAYRRGNKRIIATITDRPDLLLLELYQNLSLCLSITVLTSRAPQALAY